MNQTKPVILLQKYRSILLAAAVVEAVSFIVSLTDSIVAANVVGQEAFAAIGLISPFFSLASFLAAIVNSGTVLFYSENIGRFEKRRAHQYFTQGVLLALAFGTVFTVLLILFKENVLASYSVTADMRQYVSGYFDIIVFYFLLEPISCLLDNMVVADGGEKLSSAVNVAQIVGNVLLSVFLARRYGVRGIAIASVTCKVAFVILIMTWFLTKGCTLRLVRYLKLNDCIHIIGWGLVKGSAYAMSGIMVYVLNAFTLRCFDTETYTIMLVVEKILGMTSIFLGLSMAMQSLVGMLEGENNTKALRLLLKKALEYMVILGGLTALLLMLFAPYVARVFGLGKEELLGRAVVAICIISPSLVILSVMMFFFCCYYLIRKNVLAVVVCVIKDLVSPVAFAALFALIWKKPAAMLTGLSLSSVFTLLICAAIVFIVYGKELFPFLVSPANDDRIFIYAIEVGEEQAVRLAETADGILEKEGYPEKVQTLISVYIEDMLMLLKEINADRSRRVQMECTLLPDENGIRLIFRDDGEACDITKEEMPKSFRQYVVSGILEKFEYKIYLFTMGFNRYEFFFRNESPDTAPCSQTGTAAL
ncbi:MAG: MATE family efflux transporter [Eubacteriales bacterium]|nr:MATE family efflux transporter [Eubacteriales bacterium]